MVYVLNMDGKPLMPCSPAIARLLLKQGKAKVKRRTPFKIKLLYKTDTEYLQPLTHGLDSGSSKVGSAVSDEKGNVLYLSQIEIRNDISDKMKQRSKYRRNRRNRKTRYRKARWLNRKNSIKKDRFSPTMTSKINVHLKEIKCVKQILPITKQMVETATFDPHALKNPAVLANKWLYQKGVNYGYANTKAYVLTRDGYRCQHCKGKFKDRRLEVHHIVFRSMGGSDEEQNLITLCKTCHDALHRGEVILKKKGKKKGQLNHATQMNSIRIQLLKRTQAEETFGFVTKEHRQFMGLPKEHYFDAVAIATEGVTPTFKTNHILFKKCVSDGDYQQTKGVRSEQKIPTGKLFGFRKFDKVQYRGETYFITGRMSSGYAILMDIEQLFYVQLEELLSIPGESGNEGLIRDVVKEKLTPFVDYITVARYGNLLAEKTYKSGHGSTILLSAHLDTVDEITENQKIVKENGVWSSSEGILGADDRAGVAVLLNIAETLYPSPSFSGKIKFIFTVEEEVGLVGDVGFFQKEMKANTDIKLIS